MSPVVVVTISAAAAGYQSASAGLEVTDVETLTVTENVALAIVVGGLYLIGLLYEPDSSRGA